MTKAIPSKLGASKPTLKDVASLAGVSLKTASRVLNDDPAVKPATRESVQSAMTELRYTPDPAARSLRKGRDRTIGLIVDSIGDLFFASLAAAIEAELVAKGYHTVISSSNRDPVHERALVQDMVRRRAAGVIVSPVQPDSVTSDDIGDTPIVFVDRAGSIPGSVSVISDDFGLASEAVRHLIAHGHTRIALVSDKPKLATTRARHEAYFATLAAANIPVDPRLVRDDCQNAAQAMPAVEQLLALDEPPTAILSLSSRMSLGIVSALHQSGRTDVAFISFGDFVMADTLEPGITVIDHSAVAIGVAAARAILAQIQPGDGHAFEGTIKVPAQLISRGSGEIEPAHLVRTKQSTQGEV